MDNMRLGMKIVKTIHDHPNDWPEDIRRENAPIEALLQHPQGLVERIKDHAGMVSVRPWQVERVKQSADKIPAFVSWVCLSYMLRDS